MPAALLAGLTIISGFRHPDDEVPLLSVLIPNSGLRPLNLGAPAGAGGLLCAVPAGRAAVRLRASPQLLCSLLMLTCCPHTPHRPAGQTITLNTRYDTPNMAALKKAGALVARTPAEYNTCFAQLLEQVRLAARRLEALRAR